jgi:hypothetical protein
MTIIVKEESHELVDREEVGLSGIKRMEDLNGDIPNALFCLIFVILCSA